MSAQAHSASVGASPQLCNPGRRPDFRPANMHACGICGGVFPARRGIRVRCKDMRSGWHCARAGHLHLVGSVESAVSIGFLTCCDAWIGALKITDDLLKDYHVSQPYMEKGFKLLTKAVESDPVSRMPLCNCVCLTVTSCPTVYTCIVAIASSQSSNRRAFLHSAIRFRVQCGLSCSPRCLLQPVR